MSFFTHFDLESVLSSNAHTWQANICCSWGIAEALSVFSNPFFLSLTSAVFSLLHDKHFETNEKISNWTDESNTPFYNTIHRLVWVRDWMNSFFNFSGLFSRENCIWFPCFLFITTWLSLDTSGETTSWLTSVCSLVCWD